MSRRRTTGALFRLDDEERVAVVFLVIAVGSALLSTDLRTRDEDRAEMGTAALPEAYENRCHAR